MGSSLGACRPPKAACPWHLLPHRSTLSVTAGWRVPPSRGCFWTPRAMTSTEAGGTEAARRDAFKLARDIIQQRLNDQRQLAAEYNTVLQLDRLISHSVDNSQLPGNTAKNRYVNVLPYDYNRVQVAGVVPYLNASHVRYLDRTSAQEFRYVASQGPLQSTTCDFWRMVMGERIPAVIMLTGIKERGTTKCAQYYPQQPGDAMDVGGGLSVTCQDAANQAGGQMTVRTILITDASTTTPASWTVKHYQYLAWPDHGAPEESHAIRSLCRILQGARQQQAPSGPEAVVHCSAGIGRTGTFLAIDIMRMRLHQLANKVAEASIPSHAINRTLQSVLNLPTLVHELRQQRMSMVQTFEQYVFIYQALHEELGAALAAT